MLASKITFTTQLLKVGMSFNINTKGLRFEQIKLHCRMDILRTGGLGLVNCKASDV